MKKLLILLYLTSLLFSLSMVLANNVLATEILYSEKFETYSYGNWRNRDQLYIIDDPVGTGHGKVLKVIYPANAVNSGMNERVSLKRDVEAACLTYEVYFPPEFEFIRGKLPGLSGGNSPTGCIHSRNGFSNRFRFQRKTITQYVYHPEKKERCGEIKKVGTVESGQWNVIRSCMEIGTPGKKNGWFQAWVNGKTVGRITIKWRNKEDIKISNLLYSSFYGPRNGVPPKRRNYALFDNFVIESLNNMGEAR